MKFYDEEKGDFICHARKDMELDKRAEGEHMSATRSFNLGKHDEKLLRLAKSTGRNLTETLRLALDALEEKEARRNREMKGGNTE